MPYHVIVSRQVLLDGPMVFSATLALYFPPVRHPAAPDRPVHGAAALASLPHQGDGIVLAVAVYAFLALAPSMRTAGRHTVGAAAVRRP